MKKMLPGKRHPRWFVIFPIFSGLLWAILIVIQLLFLQGSYVVRSIGAMLVIAAVISLLLCVAGYFNAKVIFRLGALGILFGLGGMIYFYLRGGGWEDLIGPMVLLEFTGLGFLGGLLIHLIQFIVKKLRS